MANAQTENVYYVVQDGKIVTQEQLDKRFEMYQKLGKLVNKEAELKSVL